METEITDSRTSRPPQIAHRVLALHKLSPELSFGVNNITPRKLDNILNDLEGKGFTFPAVDSLQTKEAGERELFITFDDAYRHLLGSLPLLMHKHKFTPIIFVPTGYIGKTNRWDYSHFVKPEKHLSPSEIRELVTLGITFGSHTVSHCDLTSCTTDRLKRELIESKATLEDLLGTRITSISYPFGRITDEICQAAKESGYTHGYTMRFPRNFDSPLSRGRIGLYGFDTPISIGLKLGTGPLHSLERAKGRITNFLSGGTVLLNRFRGMKQRRHNPRRKS
jgi:peptidoglycan/xylan/chitin deacetylase (PgdA/CDA1 family)